MIDEYDPAAYAQPPDPAIADPYLRCERMAEEIAALRARAAELEAARAAWLEQALVLDAHGAKLTAALEQISDLRVDRDNGLQELMAKAKQIAHAALAQESGK